MSLVSKWVLAIAMTMSFWMTSAFGGILDPMATYTLDIDQDGTFQVFVEVSEDNNMGLMAYSVPLAGDITFLDNVAPRTKAVVTPFDLGFLEERTEMFLEGDSLFDDFFIQGFQKDDSAGAIFGFGQEAGDLTSALSDPDAFTFESEQLTYDAKLLIAEGLWDVAGVLPRFNSAELSGNLVAVVYSAGSTNAATDDMILTYTDGEVQMVVTGSALVPEPTSMAVMLGLGSLLLRRRRRVS